MSAPVLMNPFSSRSISGMAFMRSSSGNRRANPSDMMATPKGRPCATRFSIVVSRMSVRCSRRMGSSLGNSSAITLRVAPAAFPIPTAKWPADRPMATTKYHRFVVMASVMRLFTMSTPKLRAVSKPNVGTPPGSGRSSSIVLGTCATRIEPPAVSASRSAEYAVSSPPIVTSAPMPRSRSAFRQLRMRQ